MTHSVPPHAQFAALSVEQGGAAPAAPEEPVLEIEDIQGNILAGFNKDHQAFVFLRINDPAAARQWLRGIAPSIASVGEVLAFNRLFRALRGRRGEDPRGLIATWINIAFSISGIRKLAGDAEAEGFLDGSFQAGLDLQSPLLGDPPGEWKVGRNDKIPDVILIIGSDRGDVLRTEVDRQIGLSEGVAPGALAVLHIDWGETLPAPYTGHEHFGFKDGISQPGVRGRVSQAATDFLTPRWIDPSDDRADRFGKPGQPLVWPGQFVVGYPRQHRMDPVQPAGPEEAPAFPSWSRNGSYLVFRRLHQRVAPFHDFVRQESSRRGLHPSTFGALLVGRWPSGAPVMRAADRDDPVLGLHDLANNHFLYNEATHPIPLLPGVTDAGDNFPAAPADPNGLRCPHIAHVRKVNPRDMGTDLGSENDTLTRQVLRRGIPYGPPLLGIENPTPEQLAVDRGLLFLCYQTSISEQFETLTRTWANSTVQPSSGGHDPIIGQTAENDRQRTITLPQASPREPILISPEWVVPTGGGYFFTPSIRALTEVLGRAHS